MSVTNSSAFESLFGPGAAPRTFFCPGRINLIGEHIDYNGGFVFPAALTLGITAYIRPRTDGKIHLATTSIKGESGTVRTAERPFAFRQDQAWTNYPIGVLAHLEAEGYALSGADVLFTSTLPDGAGVSSSAAIEVLTAYAFLRISGHPEPDRVWLSRFAQGVENRFIGVNCGIMDQFAVANGKAGQGMLLNCDNLDMDYIPLDLQDCELVILNTNKRRELAESKYNERRAECDAALEILRKHGDFRDLCAVPLSEVEAHLSDPVLKARARHVVTENRRVKEAAEVLKAGNLVRFGELLNESHASLRDDYAVTGSELDAITESARTQPGCLGARMTGAGFGGCSLALVKKAHMAAFLENTAREYQAATGLEGSFYPSQIGNGVEERK